MVSQQWGSDAILKANEDGKTWTLREELIYTTDAGATITVPKGFVTDLASIPHIFWSIWPPFGKYTRAAVIHDWLYSEHRHRHGHFSRAYADAILLEAMLDCNVPQPQRGIIWFGVRIGGWTRSAWRGKPR